jgi:preprotein translocase subunit SecA
MSLLSKIFPSEAESLVKKLQPVADQVFSYEEELKTLTDEALKERSLALKAQVQKDLEGLTGEALKQTEKPPQRKE